MTREDGLNRLHHRWVAWSLGEKDRYSGEMASDDLTAEILQLAKEWSIDLVSDAMQRLGQFCSLLLEWNKRVNLTGAQSLQDLASEHLPDSFAAARLVPKSSRVVDVGSGGGLPGIPFALLRPDCRMTLVEPRAKRVAFLRAAARQCRAASISVVRGRHDVLQEAFSVAMSRATFAPDEWLGIAKGMVGSVGGVLVFSTRPVVQSGAVLEDSVKYEVGRGSERWAGFYRFP